MQLKKPWLSCCPLNGLRAVLCKNQTKWEMKNFEPPTQIYMEVGPHEGCYKCCIIPSFGVNGVACLRSTAKGQSGNLRVC